MILTKEFLQQTNACTEGYRFVLSAGLVGGDYDEAISYCRANDGGLGYGDWLAEQKNTSAYVRASGTEIIMLETFKVFDPIVGQYVECFSEDEAKAMLLVIAKQLLDRYPFNLVRAIRNENGDEAWEPIPSFQIDVVIG